MSAVFLLKARVVGDGLSTGNSGLMASLQTLVMAPEGSCSGGCWKSISHVNPWQKIKCPFTYKSATMEYIFIVLHDAVLGVV